MYYNKKNELWGSLRCKGGAKKTPPHTKIRKLEREGSSNTLEHTSCRIGKP
jgi:hypothetical protein